MKLTQALKRIGIQAPRPAQATQVVKALQRAAVGDGFQVAKRGPVDLGRLPPASAAGDADFVKGLYKDLLGREPDLEGFHSHMRGLENGMSREEIRQVFLTSPEYREKMAAPAPVVAEPTPEPSPEPAAGKNLNDARNLGPTPLEGFDANKLRDSNHNSVKYIFGRVATHHGLDQVKSKDQAEALLNKMVPDLIASGLDVRGVKGDRLLLKTPLGLESIDVVRGAGSGNPGWWWGADGTVASPAEVAKFPPLNPGAPAPTVPAPTVPTAPNLTPMNTVPDRPEYHSAPIDTSSPGAAALSAAKWIRSTRQDLFDHAADRQVDVEIMTHVIGALRAHGFDATRVVNHPSIPVGQGMRYGSDAIALDGRVYDLFIAMGEASTPTLNDVGPYEAGRLPE